MLLLIILIAGIIIFFIAIRIYYIQLENNNISNLNINTDTDLSNINLSSKNYENLVVMSYEDLQLSLRKNRKDSSITKLFKSHILETFDKESFLSNPSTYFYEEPIFTPMMIYNTGNSIQSVKIVKGLLLEDGKIKINISILGKYNGEKLQFISNTFFPEKNNIIGILRTNNNTDFCEVKMIPLNDLNSTIIKIEDDIDLDINSEFYLYISYIYYPSKNNNGGYCR